ncbi:hypothetical protein [Prosthecobacter sp.]|uniref:hypothetical protein n=1 Tax=Prosthecobacter sp. TaxID=1965333 RepID=UPI0037850E7E
MIQQRTGDLLEVEFDGKFYYLVVLTKIVMFGGNIVFAFHGDGAQRHIGSLTSDAPGFNICTDLRMPKKEGTIRRLDSVADTTAFWRTRLVKSPADRRPRRWMRTWYIYSVDDLRNHTETRIWLRGKYAAAMDSGMHSFDLVAAKILDSYAPDKNPLL